MKLTKREQDQYNIAITLPAEVLAKAAKYQATNNILSEQYCNDVKDAWGEAASIARERRGVKPRKNGERGIFNDMANPLY